MQIVLTSRQDGLWNVAGGRTSPDEKELTALEVAAELIAVGHSMLTGHIRASKPQVEVAPSGVLKILPKKN